MSKPSSEHRGGAETAKCPFCANCFEVVPHVPPPLLRSVASGAKPMKLVKKNRAPLGTRTFFWALRKVLVMGPGRWYHDFDVDVVMADKTLLVEVISSPLAYLFAIGAALAAGGTALFTGNIQMATACSVIGVFFAGFLESERAWRWWVLVAAAIPAAYGLGEEIGVSVLSLTWNPRLVGYSLLLPLPATYLGVMFRALLRRLVPQKIALPSVQLSGPTGVAVPLAVGGHGSVG